ncbi:MAG: oxalyl-CoA decarboxylase [Muribaculaceae bacterium]|nr:oxalyl-CoA decarboxylase [Muribaculaceae bacterium]
MATLNNNPAPQAQPAAPSYPADWTGQFLLAKSLQAAGISQMFGLVGIPVTEFAYLSQEIGIKFTGFRFEQQAGMAAQTYGYLTKTPGVLLTVSSLGFLNGLTATINATVNCYPMIQISGSSVREPIDLQQGTYEGLDQLSVARGLVKEAYRVNKAADIPTAVARAYRAAVSGRPGGVYLDVTTPCMAEIIPADEAQKLLDATFPLVDPAQPVSPSEEAVDRALQLIAGAKKPAFVIGKGAAYAQVEDKMKELVEKTGIPYYPMSMAKGFLPDDGPLSALSCRKEVMEEADVVVLVGARLNWLLSRGHGPWSETTQFVQLDIDPVEIDCNRKIAAPVVGDLAASLDMILAKLPNYKLSLDPTWVPYLQNITKEKDAKFAARLQANAATVPMNHWTALNAIKPVLESRPDVILVNEGANTLDDTRDTITLRQPRKRIDCATWAIMGMGMGSCVGAAQATDCSVVAIEGDSAFGFSGMDFETICRFQLPVTVVIFNNGGIYNNIGENMAKQGEPSFGEPAPTTLDINARYDKFADAFGGAAGYYVSTPEELSSALTAAIDSKKPAIINVQLAPNSGKESGHIGYLNPESLQTVIV